MIHDPGGSGDILVVDDLVPNLQVLADLLRSDGHRVRPVPSAAIAMQAAAAERPELVLMDVAMPDVDGFTATARLRSMPGLADLPVIFISASDRVEDKLMAFAKGGVDYLTKPFHADEVIARVRTHLSLARYRAAAEAQSRVLATAVAERTAELAAALERLRQLDRAKHSFLTCINHTLRTPLNGMIGVCDLVMAEPAAAPGMRASYEASRDDLIDLMEQALLLSELDLRGPGLGDRVDPAPIAAQAAVQLMRRRPPWRARAQVHGGPDARIDAPEPLVRQAVTTLLDCGMRLAGSGLTAHLAWHRADDSVVIGCRAEGARLDADRVAAFFAHLDDDRPLAASAEVQLRPFLLQRLAHLCAGTCMADLDQDSLAIDLVLPAAT